MTPQEQQMIDGLVDRIKSTQVTDKDTAAEQYLQQGLAGYPDAIYVLAQTVLVQQYGLSQAQQQIQALQAQLQQQQQQQPSGGGSFLSHLFGGSQQPSQPQYQPVNTGYPPPQYAPPVAYGQPVAYTQPASGGFMRSALQTAAGVAMGDHLLFVLVPVDAVLRGHRHRPALRHVQLLGARRQSQQGKQQARQGIEPGP